jgi:hypothetical protein
MHFNDLKVDLFLKIYFLYYSQSLKCRHDISAEVAGLDETSVPMIRAKLEAEKPLDCTVPSPALSRHSHLFILTVVFLFKQLNSTMALLFSLCYSLFAPSKIDITIHIEETLCLYPSSRFIYL